MKQAHLRNGCCADAAYGPLLSMAARNECVWSLTANSSQQCEMCVAAQSAQESGTPLILRTYREGL
jgi:hypothetical protein